MLTIIGSAHPSQHHSHHCKIIFPSFPSLFRTSNSQRLRPSPPEVTSRREVSSAGHVPLLLPVIGIIQPVCSELDPLATRIAEVTSQRSLLARIHAPRLNLIYISTHILHARAPLSSGLVRCHLVTLDVKHDLLPTPLRNTLTTRLQTLPGQHGFGRPPCRFSL